MKSNEVRFPEDLMEQLHPDCIDMCRKLLRRNPGTILYLLLSSACSLSFVTGNSSSFLSHVMPPLCGLSDCFKTVEYLEVSSL